MIRRYLDETFWKKKFHFIAYSKSLNFGLWIFSTEMPLWSGWQDQLGLYTYRYFVYTKPVCDLDFELFLGHVNNPCIININQYTIRSVVS